MRTDHGAGSPTSYRKARPALLEDLMKLFSGPRIVPVEHGRFLQRPQSEDHLCHPLDGSGPGPDPVRGYDLAIHELNHRLD